MKKLLQLGLSIVLFVAVSELGCLGIAKLTEAKANGVFVHADYTLKGSKEIKTWTSPLRIICDYFNK